MRLRRSRNKLVERGSPQPGVSSYLPDGHLLTTLLVPSAHRLQRDSAQLVRARRPTGPLWASMVERQVIAGFARLRHAAESVSASDCTRMAVTVSLRCGIQSVRRSEIAPTS